MKENRNYYIAGGVIVLIVLIAIVYMMSHRKGVAPIDTTANVPVVEQPAPKAVKPAVVPQKTVTRLTYSQALAQYDNGKRFQFDAMCQVFPHASVFSNGTTIMLDNRAGVDRTITIGGDVYKIPAYGYKLAILSESKVPVTYLVDCDAQQNPATITIE